MAMIPRAKPAPSQADSFPTYTWGVVLLQSLQNIGFFFIICAGRFVKASFLLPPFCKVSFYMQNAKKISRRTPVFFARVRLLYYGYWNFVVGGYTNCHRSLIVSIEAEAERVRNVAQSMSFCPMSLTRLRKTLNMSANRLAARRTTKKICIFIPPFCRNFVLLGRCTIQMEAAYSMDRSQLGQPVQAVFEPPQNISLIIPRIKPQGAEVVHHGLPPALLIPKHQSDKLRRLGNGHQHCLVRHFRHPLRPGALRLDAIHSDSPGMRR